MPTPLGGGWASGTGAIPDLLLGQAAVLSKIVSSFIITGNRSTRIRTQTNGFGDRCATIDTIDLERERWVPPRHDAFPIAVAITGAVSSPCS